MNNIDRSATEARLEAFVAERLTADALYLVAGGMVADGSHGPRTQGTLSICHVDGVIDGEGGEIY